MIGAQVARAFPWGSWSSTAGRHSSSGGGTTRYQARSLQASRTADSGTARRSRAGARPSVCVAGGCSITLRRGWSPFAGAAPSFGCSSRRTFSLPAWRGGTIRNALVGPRLVETYCGRLCLAWTAILAYIRDVSLACVRQRALLPNPTEGGAYRLTNPSKHESPPALLPERSCP